MANTMVSVGSALVSNPDVDGRSAGDSFKRKSLLRRLSNRVLLALCRLLPGAGGAACCLPHCRGVQVGKGVFTIVGGDRIQTEAILATNIAGSQI